jgi:predicted phage tail component-like protein
MAEITVLRYFTINGKASTDWGIVTQIDRPMVPFVDLNLLTVPMRAGAYIPIKNTSNIASRRFTISVFVNTGLTVDDLVATKRSISAFFKNLNNDGLGKNLIFSDEPTKAYSVHLQGDIQWESVNHASGIFTVTLLAGQPYAFDPTLKTVSFSGSTASVTYNGTAETFPTIRYVFSASRSSVSFTMGTKTITVTRAFVAGDNLIIDGSRNLVYLSPSTNIMANLDISSRFFSFLPSSGVNTITVASPAFLTATVEYYERHV